VTKPPRLRRKPGPKVERAMGKNNTTIKAGVGMSDSAAARTLVGMPMDGAPVMQTVPGTMMPGTMMPGDDAGGDAGGDDDADDDAGDGADAGGDGDRCRRGCRRRPSRPTP
jgi:hypothetical protein